MNPQPDAAADTCSAADTGYALTNDDGRCDKASSAFELAGRHDNTDTTIAGSGYALTNDNDGRCDKSSSALELAGRRYDADATDAAFGWWFSSFCGRIVTNVHFETFIFVLIAINSLLMGLDTLDIVRQNENLYRAFQTTELVFLVFFTIELLLDFGYRGLGMFKSGWLSFDFVIVALSWAFPTLQVVRTFRCLRLLTQFRSIRNILLALQSVVPMLGSIVLLLAVIFYVYAVIFTDSFKSMYKDGLTSIDYFSRLDITLFTLFQVMTGAGWPDIAREVMETYSWAWLPFVSFISITMFVVIELAVAALCKSVSKMEEMGVFNSGNDDSDRPIVRNRIALLEQKIDILTSKTAAEVSHSATSAPPTLNVSGTRSRPLWERLSLNIHPNAGPLERGSLNDSIGAKGLKETAQHNCLPNQIQYICDVAVNSKLLQNSVVLLIVINSITMGLGTFDFVTENPQMAKIFDAIDMTMLIFFTVEMLFQIGHHGLNFFKSGWLIFDFLIIASSWAFPSLQVARAFRCFRLFSRIDFMREIIEALISVMPNLAVIAMLLMLGFYIFSVIFTDLFKDMYSLGLTSEDYFSNIPTTLFTLFQCMTIAGWPVIAREVMETYDWAWMPFITWIVISKFVVIQLIIALLCQSLSRVSTEEEKESDSDEISRLEQKLSMLASNIDALTATGKP